MTAMNSNISLRTSFVVSILLLAVIVPVGVFASPIFETDTVRDAGTFKSEPEQSWADIDGFPKVIRNPY